jgi:protein-tyrosine phosphatase
MLARRGLTGVNRLLHPRRRKKARARLVRALPIRRVLVLCTGNICRSPYASARLKELSDPGPDLEVRSAGLIGPDRPAPDNARSAAEKRGLDLEDHISQLVTREAVEWAELIVVMALKHARALIQDFGVASEKIIILGDLDPGNPERRTIQDPVDRAESYFLRSYERIDRCLEELITLVRIGP